MQPVTILIADDDPMVRQCIRRMVEADSQFQIRWEADNGLQAMLLAKKHRPQVILMDAQMPRMDGMEATRCLRQSDPEVRIVILAVYEHLRAQAIAAGADAFVIKDCGCETIRATIYGVLESVPHPMIER